MPSSKTHCFFCLSLLLWLSMWMAWSWGAVQDDAFIHLRYANNLFSRSFVTYDGVHPSFGSSSLLYIGLLSLLRRVTASPQLPRAVSSAVHVLLFAGLAVALNVFVARRAIVARVAGALLLVMLVTPSAVRWLDDGMETGLVVLVVTVMAWLIHRSAEEDARSRMLGWALMLSSFLAVMLRTELLLLCGVGFVILILQQRREGGQSSSTFGPPNPESTGEASIMPVVAIGVGAAVAVAMILSMMHALLPDTAVAKSHGVENWMNPIHDTAITLGGAFSFGAGMLCLWLLTLGLVVLRGGLTLRSVLANCFCPVVLALSSLRGQEIQGVRYFAWTFVFSIVWNILDLEKMVDRTVWWSHSDSRGAALLYLFAGVLLMELPAESLAMQRVLTRRSETLRVFRSQHLDVLRGRRGVAADIGYIGYFSGGEICDLAGLVNGRQAARMSSKERVKACALTKPDFMFLNGSQYGPMAAVIAMDDWMVCGQYDFTNVRTADRHYLIVRPELANEVCKATGRQPEPVAAVLVQEPELVAQRVGK